jgi:hypothetical protein
VDSHGNIWFADTLRHRICEIPVGPLDSRGNPTYDWAKARVVLPRDISPLRLEPTMVQPVTDGSFYVFGWSAPWPAPRPSGLWMAGTTLLRYDASGQQLWAAHLPELCVGMDIIPGTGGCMVGGSAGAKVFQYAPDGLLIGRMQPGAAMDMQSGYFDNHSCVVVDRDPRDSQLDIFTEDVAYNRIGWYRASDRPAQTISGDLRLDRK